MAKSLSIGQINVLSLILETHHGFAFVGDLVEDFQGADFTLSIVGKARYDRFHSLLSRTIARLKARGLVRVFKETVGQATLIMVTPQAVKILQQLNKK
jgi:hypothetical protein